MTFSANPDVGATLGATAHLIPQVSLGVKALDGIASASVFLNLDASLGLQGSISSATNPQPCLSGNAEINVAVGAEGSFFGLFDANTGKSLFDKNFPLFQVCAHNLLYTSYFGIFIIHFTRRQQCFGGNSTTSSQSSAPDSTAAPSASQTSAASAPITTDSASQTSATNTASQTGATDSASQTSATNTASQTGATDSASQISATDSASQSGATDSASQTSATDSASQASATDATATPNPRRRYDAPRALRRSARFGRSFISTEPDSTTFSSS